MQLMQAPVAGYDDGDFREISCRQGPRIRVPQAGAHQVSSQLTRGGVSDRHREPWPASGGPLAAAVLALWGGSWPKSSRCRRTQRGHSCRRSAHEHSAALEDIGPRVEGHDGPLG
ncbi:hypothetical protein GCM10009771_04190 [Nesterenkonia flava]